MPRKRSGHLSEFRISFGNVLKAKLIKGYSWLCCITQILETITVLGPSKCFISRKRHPTAKLNISLFKTVSLTPIQIKGKNERKHQTQKQQKR